MNIKGFNFSLETFLKVKKIHKAQLELKLSDAKNTMDAHKRELETLAAENKRLDLKLTRGLYNGIEAKELKEIGRYQKRLFDKISDCNNQYNGARAVYLGLQDSLVKLLNEIKVLEKLKNKQLMEFFKDLQRQEEIQLEERTNYKIFIQGGGIYG